MMNFEHELKGTKNYNGLLQMFEDSESPILQLSNINTNELKGIWRVKGNELIPVSLPKGKKESNNLTLELETFRTCCHKLSSYLWQSGSEITEKQATDAAKIVFSEAIDSEGYINHKRLIDAFVGMPRAATLIKSYPANISIAMLDQKIAHISDCLPVIGATIEAWEPVDIEDTFRALLTGNALLGDLERV